MLPRYPIFDADIYRVAQGSYPMGRAYNDPQSRHSTYIPQAYLNRVLPPPITPTSVIQQSPIRNGPMRYDTLPLKASDSRPDFQIMAPQVSGQRLCSAVSNCDYTTPKRRIVSQFFGRNKKETRLIPRHCWAFYCRQHYQRSRYRLNSARFAELQMSLVQVTVVALEKEGIVICWEIKLRKRALEQVIKADRDAKGSKKFHSNSTSSSAASSGSCSRERLLLASCGTGKSFQLVYDVLELVREICRRDQGSALEFELLPSFTEDHQMREEERRRAHKAECDGSDSESEDDD